MKQLFTFTLLIIFFSNAFSQEEKDFLGFEKKDIYLNGQLNYTKNESNNLSQTVFSFQPSVGYFLDNSNALEFGLIIGSNKSGQSETNSFGAQAGLVHFFNLKNKFSFTLGGGLSYVSSKFENAFQGDFKSNLFQIAVFPGVNYFISEKFSLRANIGAFSYVSEKADFQGAETNNSFTLNLNLSNVNFGLLYKF